MSDRLNTNFCKRVKKATFLIRKTLEMPRGGTRKGAGAKIKCRLKNAGGKRKGAGAPVGNSNSLGKGAPEGNSNSLGNKGGAPLGSSNSSSHEKKANTLFTQGRELERYGDDIGAMSKYREVIQLYPEHADANYCLARLLSLRYYNGDFVVSGDHSQIIKHYEVAHRGGCKLAMHNMRKLQYQGDHREKEAQPSDKDCVALVEHFRTFAAEAQAVSDASPGQADLLVASSNAHFMFAHVVIRCSCAGTLPAAYTIAETEMLLSVKQDPSSFSKHAQLANIYWKSNMIDSAMTCFEKALKIKPNYTYAIQSLKSLGELGHLGRESGFWDPHPRKFKDCDICNWEFEFPLPYAARCVLKEASESSDDDQWSDEESGGNQMSDEEGDDGQVSDEEGDAPLRLKLKNAEVSDEEGDAFL